MRTLIIAAAALVITAGIASAQAPYGTGSNPYGHPVQGYTNNNGTYVQPHYQSNPNATRQDNWSTRGNVNPYTGQPGTR